MNEKIDNALRQVAAIEFLKDIKEVDKSDILPSLLRLIRSADKHMASRCIVQKTSSDILTVTYDGTPWTLLNVVNAVNGYRADTRFEGMSKQKLFTSFCDEYELRVPIEDGGSLTMQIKRPDNVDDLVDAMTKAIDNSVTDDETCFVTYTFKVSKNAQEVCDAMLTLVNAAPAILMFSSSLTELEISTDNENYNYQKRGSVVFMNSLEMPTLYTNDRHITAISFSSPIDGHQYPGFIVRKNKDTDIAISLNTPSRISILVHDTSASENDLLDVEAFFASRNYNAAECYRGSLHRLLPKLSNPISRSNCINHVHGHYGVKILFVHNNTWKFNTLKYLLEMNPQVVVIKGSCSEVIESPMKLVVQYFKDTLMLLLQDTQTTYSEAYQWVKDVVDYVKGNPDYPVTYRHKIQFQELLLRICPMYAMTSSDDNKVYYDVWKRFVEKYPNAAGNYEIVSSLLYPYDICNIMANYAFYSKEHPFTEYAYEILARYSKNDVVKRLLPVDKRKLYHKAYQYMDAPAAILAVRLVKDITELQLPKEDGLLTFTTTKGAQSYAYKGIVKYFQDIGYELVDDGSTLLRSEDGSTVIISIDLDGHYSWCVDGVKYMSTAVVDYALNNRNSFTLLGNDIKLLELYGDNFVVVNVTLDGDGNIVDVKLYKDLMNASKSVTFNLE